MKQAAHALGTLAATSRDPQTQVPIDSIATTGFPLEKYADVEKVQRMQRKLQKGKPLPPVKLTRLTPALRDKYGVRDPSKEFYLNGGHHRLAAQKLEGRESVNAVPYHGKGL